MSPELRAGNASLRASGDETLEAVQRSAAAAGQFLPVDADGALTVRELLQHRDGGPLEAQYGRLRDRVLAAGIGGLSLGSESVKDVAGYDLRRMLLGNAPVDWAVFRLARLPDRRERLIARGGDAFALAEALRADPAAPPALVVLEPSLLALADDCGNDEQPRRRALVERCARAAGASLETLAEPDWLGICAGLPTGAVRMAGRDARLALPQHDGAWAYDAGRRLALVTPAARELFLPARPAPPASAELVAKLLGAVSA
jgi:FAD/FMN-containing dehydrogenase